jgi:hypothetical protein
MRNIQAGFTFWVNGFERETEEIKHTRSGRDTNPRPRDPRTTALFVLMFIGFEGLFPKQHIKGRFLFYFKNYPEIKM